MCELATQVCDVQYTGLVKWATTLEPHEVRVTLFCCVLYVHVCVHACAVGWSLKAVVPAGERAGGQRAGDA